jgi:hypothetical protein
MPERWLLDLQRSLEQADAEDNLATTLVVVAAVAGKNVPLDEDELHAATRRATLLLAAGGDPERGLDLNGRAVTGLAADLDAPDRRSALAQGLAEVRAQAVGLAELTEAIRALENEPDIAWRAYACSLLAEWLDPD